MKQKNVLLGLFLLLVNSISVNAMELAKIDNTKIKNFKEITSIRSRQELGLLKLLHDGNDFYVKDNKSTKQVPRYFLDKPLKEMKSEHLKKFQEHGYINIKRLSSGEYKLDTHVRGNGGGVWGAIVGFWGGKLLVHGAAQGTYALISGGVGLVCPPAAPVVYGALQYTFAAPVEAASNVAAIGSSIALGTATGPV